MGAAAMLAEDEYLLDELNQLIEMDKAAEMGKEDEAVAAAMRCAADTDSLESYIARSCDSAETTARARPPRRPAACAGRPARRARARQQQREHARTPQPPQRAQLAVPRGSASAFGVLATP